MLQKGPSVIPVEVKAGVHTRTKSLNQFIPLYDPPYGNRLSGKDPLCSPSVQPSGRMGYLVVTFRLPAFVLAAS